MDYQRKAQNHFTDLENTFYTDAILGANAAGVILGDEGTVRPKDAISRQEAAVMLGRADVYKRQLLFRVGAEHPVPHVG